MGRVSPTDPLAPFALIAAGPHAWCEDVDPEELSTHLADPSGDQCVVMGQPMDPAQIYTLFAEDMYLGANPDPRHTVFVDGCLSLEVAGHLDSYLGAAQYGLADDLQFLEDRLGPLPIPRGTMYVSRPSQEGSPSFFVDGAYLIVPFTGQGDPFSVAFPDQLEHTVVHELAHTWFGYGVTFADGRDPLPWDPSRTPSAAWLTEAMPTLLAEMRYPEPDQPALARGHRHWAEAMAHVGPQPNPFDFLETDFTVSDGLLGYHVGAFVAAQLYYTLPLVDGGLSTDDAVWDRISATLTDPTIRGVQHPMGPDDVASWMESLGAGPFYDDWIRVVEDPDLPGTSFEKGFPHLGIVEMIEDEAAHTVTVRVADVRSAPRHVFQDAPFFIGCSNYRFPSDAPAGCDGDDLGFTTMVPRSVATDSQVVLSYPGNGDPVPFEVALWAGPGLLPENRISGESLFYTPTAGHPFPAPPTWKLYCTDYADPTCTPDAYHHDPDDDLDGFPNMADCLTPDPLPANVTDADVHFLGPLDTGLSVDRNCDGWPVPSVAQAVP